MSSLRILYVGPDYVGSNGTSWRDAFVQLGHEVRTIDDESFIPRPSSGAGRIWGKLRGRPSWDRIGELNRAVQREVNSFVPDLTFYIKARYVLPETLKHSGACGPNFAYMNDDMFNPRNQTFTFFDNLLQFDCIFTTKSYNVREFHAAGAPLALYIPNAFDPAIHRPVVPQPQERKRLEGDVGFLGTFRPQRADFLSGLTNHRGEFKTNIWGNGWEKMNRADHWRRRWAWRHVARSVRGGELRGLEMAKAIQANRVCLGLLYHENMQLEGFFSFIS